MEICRFCNQCSNELSPITNDDDKHEDYWKYDIFTNNIYSDKDDNEYSTAFICYSCKNVQMMCQRCYQETGIVHMCKFLGHYGQYNEDNSEYCLLRTTNDTFNELLSSEELIYSNIELGSVREFTNLDLPQIDRQRKRRLSMNIKFLIM
jgi:hypothetical protein